MRIVSVALELDNWIKLGPGCRGFEFSPSIQSHRYPLYISHSVSTVDAFPLATSCLPSHAVWQNTRNTNDYDLALSPPALLPSHLNAIHTHMHLNIKINHLAMAWAAIKSPSPAIFTLPRRIPLSGHYLPYSRESPQLTRRLPLHLRVLIGSLSRRPSINAPAQANPRAPSAAAPESRPVLSLSLLSSYPSAEKTAPSTIDHRRVTGRSVRTPSCGRSVRRPRV